MGSLSEYFWYLNEDPEMEQEEFAYISITPELIKFREEYINTRFFTPKYIRRRGIKKIHFIQENLLDICPLKE